MKRIPFLRYVLALAIVLISLPTNAVTDSLQVSLLTCAPGNESYSFYGHTAIRIHDLRTNEDVVYNYGMFDSRKPHFVWNFIMGRTDYELGTTPFEPFIASYVMRGRYVDEQVLDLTPNEAQRLNEALRENARPERRGYRYNFMNDNCTTRAVERIEQCVGGTITYTTEHQPEVSFRDIIHGLTAEHPWSSLGNDLLLGAEIDTLLSRKGEMFSPAHAEEYMAEAVVLRSDGSERPLVKETFRYPVMHPLTNKSHFITPNMVALLLMVLTCVCTWHEWRKKKIGKMGNTLDILLTLLQGGAGCIIALLFFCSEHPAVGSNWLVMWLNPLPLLWLPLQIWRTSHGKRDIYSPVLIGVLLLFCICGHMGVQKFPTAVWVLASVLLTRACARTFINIGQQNK